METFWYRLTQVHLEKWPLKRRERERERERERLRRQWRWSWEDGDRSHQNMELGTIISMFCKVYACCLHMVLWYKAIFVCSSVSGSAAGNTELRPIRSYWEGSDQGNSLHNSTQSTQAWIPQHLQWIDSNCHNRYFGFSKMQNTGFWLQVLGLSDYSEKFTE